MPPCWRRPLRTACDEFPGQPVDGFGLVLRQGGTARQLGDRRRLVGEQLAFYCLAVWKENLSTSRFRLVDCPAVCSVSTTYASVTLTMDLLRRIGEEKLA